MLLFSITTIFLYGNIVICFYFCFRCCCFFYVFILVLRAYHTRKHDFIYLHSSRHREKCTECYLPYIINSLPHKEEDQRSLPHSGRPQNIPHKALLFFLCEQNIKIYRSSSKLGSLWEVPHTPSSPMKYHVTIMCAPTRSLS